MDWKPFPLSRSVPVEAKAGRVGRHARTIEDLAQDLEFLLELWQMQAASVRPMAPSCFQASQP